KTPQDSCIDCHMPNYGAADIPHTAVTDHRILRDHKHPPAADDNAAPGDGFPIVSFYRGRPGMDNAEDDRSRAVAILKLTLLGDPAASRVARYVLPALEAALRRDPDDLAARDAQAYALNVQERPAEALPAFQAALAKAPERESTLLGTAL